MFGAILVLCSIEPVHCELKANPSIFDSLEECEMVLERGKELFAVPDLYFVPTGQCVRIDEGEPV